MLIDGISGNIWQQQPPEYLQPSFGPSGIPSPSPTAVTLHPGRWMEKRVLTGPHLLSESFLTRPMVATVCGSVPSGARRLSAASRGAPQQPGQLPGLVYAAVAFVCTLDTG